MSDRDIDIEVAYARSDKQVIISVNVVEGLSVQQVITESEILKRCSEIDLRNMAVGVFGKVCKLERIVAQGDRVEIYRPLLQNPMEARRNRADNK